MHARRTLLLPFAHSDSEQWPQTIGFSEREMQYIAWSLEKSLLAGLDPHSSWLPLPSFQSVLPQKTILCYLVTHELVNPVPTCVITRGRVSGLVTNPSLMAVSESLYLRTLVVCKVGR
jgi:hypothetical protein